MCEKYKSQKGHFKGTSPKTVAAWEKKKNNKKLIILTPAFVGKCCIHSCSSQTWWAFSNNQTSYQTHVIESFKFFIEPKTLLPLPALASFLAKSLHNETAYDPEHKVRYFAPEPFPPGRY